MSTTARVGKEIVDVDLYEIFEPFEGSIDQIYGRVGMGKTYAATKDIIDELMQGRVVYANWRVNFSGFDERSSFLHIILGLFGIKRAFYRIDKHNFHYLPLNDKFMGVFEKLTDCSVYLDEGHLIFDSYQHAKFSLQKRAAILHTRHFNRKLVIVSQRPTAIHVSARGNVNRFFKVERWLKWPVLLFTKTEFQDMANETVDETKPLRTKMYLGKKSILQAYDSKYLRGDTPRSQDLAITAYKVGWFRSWLLLWNFIRGNQYPDDYEVTSG